MCAIKVGYKIKRMYWVKFHAPDLYLYAKVDLHETVINSHYLAFDRPWMQLLNLSSA